jgi:hypothetical protein
MRFLAMAWIVTGIPSAYAQYGGKPTIPPAVVERLENQIDEQRQRIDMLMRRSMTVFDEDTILKRLKAVEDRQKLFEDAFIKKMEEGKVRKP